MFTETQQKRDLENLRQSSKHLSSTPFLTINNDTESLSKDMVLANMKINNFMIKDSNDQ
jgi:hypothetical protein